MIFDDYTCHYKGDISKEEHIDHIVELINNLHKNNKIKDIMLIARTTDMEPAPKGLPHNAFNALTVDNEYETNVFMRFATDILFSKAKQIAVKDYLEKYNTEENINEIRS